MRRTDSDRLKAILFLSISLSVSDACFPGPLEIDALASADTARDAEPDVFPMIDSGTDAQSDAGCTADGCSHLDAPCRRGICGPLGVCTTVSVDEPCSDGLACTVDDRCDHGVCTADLRTCDDGRECSVDTCDEGNGGCVADTSGCECTKDADCDDGNPCDGTEICDGQGACKKGTPLVCPDLGVQCRKDVCVVTGGRAVCSQVVADEEPCDDANPCTDHDHCSVGECHGGEVACTPDDNECSIEYCDPQFGCQVDMTGCECLVDDDCETDNNLCNGKSTCLGLTCVPGEPVECTPSTVACRENVCLPALGECYARALGNGFSCDDGDKCTAVDSCSDGACMGGGRTTCEAPDDCHTAGTCDPQTGTCPAPKPLSSGSCDDGNACTDGETCVDGDCVDGVERQCGAPATCHEPGICNPQTGECEEEAIADGQPCDDGDLCTSDQCLAGKCVGAPRTCVPHDSCDLAGTCDSATGRCLTAEDGSFCGGGVGTCDAGKCQPYLDLAAGWWHVCALARNLADREKDRVKCWGYDGHGELGQGGGAQGQAAQSLPALSFGAPIEGVLAGHRNTCVVDSFGGIQCWGDGVYGVNGNGDTAALDTPPDQPIELGQGVGAIPVGAISERVVCTLVQTGGDVGVKCWGTGALGLPGVSVIGDSPDNLPSAFGALQVGMPIGLTSGQSSNCVLDGSQDEVRCWGTGPTGQLGVPGQESATSPTSSTAVSLREPDDGSIMGIAGGEGHTCALIASNGPNRVRCWGDGSHGQLGLGPAHPLIGRDEAPTTLPAVDFGEPDAVVQSVRASYDATCVLLETPSGDRHVKCFGGAFDPVGPTAMTMPGDIQPIEFGGAVHDFVVGLDFICAVLATGDVRCKGANDFGQLGRGGTAAVPIDGPAPSRTEVF
ncbi:MAG: RCC1 domain-containing protein [Myxococcota bacterium]